MNKGKLKALIIDDEVMAIETLSGLLEEYCPDVTLCGTYSNPVEALKAIPDLNPELLFLDIQMPVVNGLDFLRIIGQHQLHTIYVSGHKEFAIQALRLHAADYLLKPVDPSELQNAVKEARDRIRSNRTLVSTEQFRNEQKDSFQKPESTGNPELNPDSKSLTEQEPGQYPKSPIGSEGELKSSEPQQTSPKDYLRVPHQDGFRMVFIPDILRIEADNSYSTLYLRDGLNMIVSKGIRDFDSLLPEQSFVRVHRSHIINLRFVFAYSVVDGGQVTLSNGDLVPVSRRRLKILKEKLDQWSTKLG